MADSSSEELREKEELERKWSADKAAEKPKMKKAELKRLCVLRKMLNEGRDQPIAYKCGSDLEP